MYSLTFWPKFAHFCHFSISTQNHSHWIFVKIPQNTKCIALLFGQNLPIFATFEWRLKSGKNGRILAKNSPYTLGILANFDENSMWVILSGDWKVAKMGEFWPKSKAIHLVFWRILTKIQCEWFWVEIEKWQKWANFGQKVRLYTWYFGEFSPKFNVSDFEWRLKSGKNGRILAKK